MEATEQRNPPVWVRFETRLDPETARDLDAWSEASGLSKAEIVREALRLARQRPADRR